MKKIETMANNPVFKKLTMTENDKRMKSDELVLRFLAFSSNWNNYTKPLADFLNKYCENNKNMSEQDLLAKESFFLATLNTVNVVLGNKSFRTFDQAHKSPKFNAALFDAQMIAFAELDLQSPQIEKLLKENLNELNYEFIASEPFMKYISSGTTDKNSVTGRINGYKGFVSSVLGR